MEYNAAKYVVIRTKTVRDHRLAAAYSLKGQLLTVVNKQKDLGINFVFIDTIVTSDFFM